MSYLMTWSVNTMLHCLVEMDVLKDLKIHLCPTLDNVSCSLSLLCCNDVRLSVKDSAGTYCKTINVDCCH